MQRCAIFWTLTQYKIQNGLRVVLPVRADAMHRQLRVSNSATFRPIQYDYHQYAMRYFQENLLLENFANETYDLSEVISCELPNENVYDKMADRHVPCVGEQYYVSGNVSGGADLLTSGAVRH